MRDWVVSLVLFPACVYFCLTRGEYTFLDSADLIIHEAGHFFFRFFGSTLHYAGGTLMQVLLPGVLTWHFLRHNYGTGMQLMLFWLGHNLINISVYAADARARLLPLLGGDRVKHDWHTLLSRWDLLEYDQAIGDAFFVLAICCFAVTLMAPRFVSGEAGRVLATAGEPTLIPPRY